MAITIEQQPRLFTPNKNPLIFVLTSDNSDEDGFRIKCEIVYNSTTLVSVFLAPNPNGSVVFDAMQFVTGRANMDNPTPTNSHAVVDYGQNVRVFRVPFEVRFTEWWLIDGVLTENDDSDESSNGITYYSGYFDNKAPFNPDTSGSSVEYSFALDGNTKRMFSDRKYDTNIWQMAASLGLAPSTQTIFIPVFENDWGILSYGTIDCIAGSLADKLQITIYAANGSPTTHTEGLEDYGFLDWGVYPANLNQNTLGYPKPSDFPNWRFYTVRTVTTTDTICSATYVFYNASLYGQTDCKHDRVRIAWANSRGGWDYFNFIKRNEESLNVTRKQYTKIRGNYGTATDTFTYGSYDSGLTTLATTATKSLTVNSDWISENEFIFLQSLLVSDTIHWVQDDGSFFPVVLDATDYTLARERNGKLKNVSFKFTMANDYI